MPITSLVNEGSSHPLEIEFLDEDGAAYAPVSASYKVLCMTTKTTVRPAEAIASPQSAIEIELTADDNTLQNPAENDRECRRVIVAAVNAEGRPYNDSIDYYVQKLEN